MVCQVCCQQKSQVVFRRNHQIYECVFGAFPVLMLNTRTLDVSVKIGLAWECVQFVINSELTTYTHVHSLLVVGAV